MATKSNCSSSTGSVREAHGHLGCEKWSLGNGNDASGQRACESSLGMRREMMADELGMTIQVIVSAVVARVEAISRFVQSVV